MKDSMKKNTKLYILVPFFLVICLCLGISLNTSDANNTASIAQIANYQVSNKNAMIVLSEQEIDNLSDMQVDKLWSSNNPRSFILTGTMDGEITKRYKAWEVKYKSQVVGAKDQRGLEDNTDLTIYIKNLNIKTSDYQDIRLIIDYIANGGASCLTNSYCLEVYVVDTNQKKFGPFHLESYEPNGFYIRNQGSAKRYDRGFNLIIEKLKVPGNTIIKELEIKPYGNYPAKMRIVPQQPGSRNWRGRDALTFAMAGVKVMGFKDSNYQRPTFVKSQKIDVGMIREKAVKRMYNMATIKWVPAVGFGSMYASLVKSNSKVIHPQGSENYGLPYTQRNRATLEKFADEIKDGVLSVPDNITEMWGVDCTGSVDYAISKFVPLPVMYLTPDFIWDRNKFTLLGNLKIDGRENSSEALKQNYSAQEVYEAFAQLQIGDILSTHCQKGAHTRLVTGRTHVVRDGDGLVDPESSYVIITETSSGLADMSDKNNFGGFINADDYAVPFEPKKEYTDLKDLKDLEGKNTNFRVNKKITFKQLFNGCYVPLTLNAYLTGTIEEPYVRIINPNTIDNIKNGFKGTIYSNYTILSLTFNIKNTETGEKKTFIVYPNHASGTLEGKYNGMYSLYYNTPKEIQNYLKSTIRNAKHFEVLVTVSAGEKENMEVLKLKS